MTVYLDFSATTPVHPEVADLINKFMLEEFGNAGSRTHEFGVNAKRAVELARAQIAQVVEADKTEVLFTSGATESNNIVILGLRNAAESQGKKHIITTKTEHKAVLEPIQFLEQEGFEVTYLDVDQNGDIDLVQLQEVLRLDTFLVSVMHVNNETGVINPIEEICALLAEHEAFLHVDAAQGFGKLQSELQNQRIDFISVSGHKLYAPKGVGALIMRKRGFKAPPLKPIMFGGGQEKGIRPGTLATPLVAGLGLASELAARYSVDWKLKVESEKKRFQTAIESLGGLVNGGETSPYILNFSIPGINSEAAMVALKGVAAVSNGSACTSSSYKPSHVLSSMGLEPDRISSAIRVSFSPFMEPIPYEEILKRLNSLL